MNQAITALETPYDGHLFRSRLEARWAVFFNALGVPYEYEPQGYNLPSGPYLPDFYLPTLETHFEVKHEAAEDDPRWREFAQGVGRLFVAFGMRKPDACPWDSKRPDSDMEIYDELGWDNFQDFNCCRHCGVVSIQFCDYAGRACGHEEQQPPHPRIERAYLAARSARFEHGQKGAML